MTFDLMTQTHAAPFVVLGPGCCGSNYVASALHSMGVSMGTKFTWTDPANPGAFEDVTLRDLDASCVSRKVSTREWLFRFLGYCEDRGAAGTQWGMSDPRLCDLGEWLRHALPHGRFIRVNRPIEDAIRDCELIYGVGAGDKVARKMMLRRQEQLDRHFRQVDLEISYGQSLNPSVLFPRLRDFVKERAYKLVM